MRFFNLHREQLGQRHDCAHGVTRAGLAPWVGLPRVEGLLASRTCRGSMVRQDAIISANEHCKTGLDCINA